MPRINVDLDYLDHPKVDRLESLLGKGSRALPVWLWLYCGKYHAETGRLIGISASKLEAKILWWGRPGEAVSALLDCGFLEVVDGDYQVHDWDEWQGHIHKYHLKAKAMRARQLETKKAGQPPAPSAVSPAQSPAASPATELNGREQYPPNPPTGGEGFLFQSQEGRQAWIDWIAYRGERYGRRAQDKDLARLADMGGERHAMYSIRETIAANHNQLHDVRGKPIPETAAERTNRIIAEQLKRREEEEEARRNAADPAKVRELLSKIGKQIAS